MINIIAGGTPLAHRLHADVSNWYTRFRKAGGRVGSNATLQAFDTFANAIAAASIRDKFYRLNSFAGDDLTTALVPFYLGPTTGGTEYGYAVDQNNGPFLGSDYALATGITGNATSKFLLTGLTVAATGIASLGHISGDRMTTTPKNDTIISANSAIAGGNYWLFITNTTPATMRGTWGASTNATSAADATGLITVTRTASNVLKVYDDGVEIATSSSAPATPGHSVEIAIFASNTDGTRSNYYDGPLGGYTIGAALNPTQAADLAAAWATLRTALGR